ncbi:MAG: hypothetical protein ETSY2_29770 [Candidatus Entotheonella gemina]|uniref:CRISPR-associated protein Csx3 n=1 Tax=Candidatus Entotheonella gemina TaxID=1429439 RepID=W4M2V3_9BACT|nr:MAG: hypothetical protein ETSY2_29770 [Candidatus Entotheonella gemina]
MITIDLSTFYEDGQAELSQLPAYVAQALSLVGQGQDVKLTGAASIWLYLKIAHALHGVARTLVYDSPVTGEVVIFNHNPF